MGLRLVVRSSWSSEPGSEYVYEFDQARVVIGRSASADVCIPHAAVSACHATVRAQGAGYVLQDEDSTNGSVVNGTRLPPGRPKPLRSGDSIEIGGFQIDFSASVAVAEATSLDRTSALARLIVREALGRDDELDLPRLLVLNGPDEGISLTIPEPPARLLVGRAEECDLCLVDGDASRQHAEIDRDLDGVLIRDLGAKNPLAVNGRVTRERRLKDRDEVSIGATVLVFEDPAEQAVRAITSEPDVEMALPTATTASGRPSHAPGDTGDDDAPSGDEEDAPAVAPEPSRASATPIEPPAAPGGSPAADIVIYVLAAAVLLISIAGLVILLRSG